MTVFTISVFLGDDPLTRLAALARRATRRRERRTSKQLLRHLAGTAGHDRTEERRPDRDTSFTEKGRDYWLRHCHGFLVDTVAGDEVGVVDDVALDARAREAATLIVACGWFGRRRLSVPVDEVETILPGSRQLFLRRFPEDPARP